MGKLKAFLGAFFVAVFLAATAGQAFGANVADTQGFCKRVGGSCNGGSECSTAHQRELPGGQAKKC